MGITWRFTMVLLSTLAALVIIVHSAEEEYENQYRRGLRPRALDTGTRRYEQPWRTLEVEPLQQQSTSRAELDDTSSEEPPRRRRPGRKRKRRPEPTSEEDVSSNERFTYLEDRERPHFEDLSTERQTSEMPKRRRKKIERRLKWADSLEEDRPTRRRGHRRKRPSKETWPELSEFNDFRPKEASRNIDEEVSTDQVMTMNEDRHGDIFGSTMQFTQKQSKDNMESREDTFELDEKTKDKISEKDPNDFRRKSTYSAREKEDGLRNKTPVVNDKSLSEFSSEVLGTPVEQKTDKGKRKNDEKKNIKIPDSLENMEKAQDSGPIDPLTLKDILKKSNGTSLSEILQQHNLSLADLLHGKELALSILKSENPGKSTQHTTTKPSVKPLETMSIIANSHQHEYSEDKLLHHSETKYVTEPITETPDDPTTLLSTQYDEEDLVTEEIGEITSTARTKTEETTKKINTRRFPTANRRKQRIRPVITNNYKSQLNRDMLALTARKYFYNNSRRRNTTKSQEWKDVIPLMKKNATINNENSDKPNIETTEPTVEETTIRDTNYTTVSSIDNNNIFNDTKHNDIDKEVSQNKTQVAKVENIKPTNDTDEPKLIQSTTPMNASGLRRQAFDNILKKKRRKQKNLTTEPPQAQDDFMKNLFGMPNLVSSSEFIERTQGPKTSLDDVTILDDFITTELPSHLKNKSRKNVFSTKSPTTYRQIFIPSSTEESAKIEIEEILNDTLANARLSKILMERNMTLNELVEHRERGSSHVHLADIFHNASKEPNPPEPFLSKSAIEPISKETYPLRALLDANIHDTTTKASTIDTEQDEFFHIPMKMDFGNNVNENDENMGIMSLFKNITKSNLHTDAFTVMKDSEGTPYSASVFVVNTTDIHEETNTVREGKSINSLPDSQEDIVGWNEIFALMRWNYENKTKELTGLIPAESIRKPLEDDLYEDGLIVLEDLKRLNEFSSKIASDERLGVQTNERTEAPKIDTGSLDKKPSQSKSMTLAIASIAGLAMVLFLLIFVGYRWRQQRALVDNKNFPDERIPTPVFENRKGHKNNCSTRSISPMISSNIYTLSTMDSQNGKESPDYMWDSLRKPFQ